MYAIRSYYDNKGYIYFAQNDQKKPSDRVSTDDASKTHKDTDKPETLTQEKNIPNKTKPMKEILATLTQYPVSTRNNFV